jgi:phosphoglucosamine mutase
MHGVDGMMERPRLFGTDGVRGIANVEPMTAETAVKLGRAVAQVCAPPGRNRPRVVLARDTRISGSMLESALTAGLGAMGVDTLLAGVLPTPAVAFLTRCLRADAGVVISASHNPFPDNGLKVFRRDGRKLSDAEEDAIEAAVAFERWTRPPPQGADVGQGLILPNAMGRYLQFCRQTFPADRSLEGLRIVLDCANGATYQTAPPIFEELGADVSVIHGDPNGFNINHGCGATDVRDLVQAVKASRADLGLAFDGDGDRLLAVDETGSELSGDHILAICARQAKDQGRPQSHRVVATVMSNFGFRIAMQEQGIEVLECPVGDRQVAETMRRQGAALGGEASGHLIFGDLHTTGDGIIAGLQLVLALVETGKTLSGLASILTLTPQHLINVDISRKPPLDDVPEIREAVHQAEQKLGSTGRVLIRYSGTQAVCRVMVEGRDDGLARRLAGTLADTVRTTLG